MKYISLLSLILIFATAISLVEASNWSPEDYEIFSLNDKVQQDLGKGASFYSWLELPNGPKSTLQEISKAYRKKSRILHPDKVSGSKSLKKQAEERFQRLSLVGNILRDQSLRRRYDYFHSKGFPRWKGTGYYYSKFRPGIIMTVMILYIIVGGIHFVAMKISRKQDFKRLKDLKEETKKQAWGGSQIPPADGSSRKVFNDTTGKQFMITPDGNVSLIVSEPKKESYLISLDENDINLNPGFKESLFFKLPCSLWNVSLGKALDKTIDTTVVFENPNKQADITSNEQTQKTKKKIQRGQIFELSNGKKVYGRNGASTTQKRKQK
ncbi:DEHA2G19250p [Debaryomyces hansenii CBS767]|uniref:DEHA2G19250p n=1 Tax=Debaryomyces hansenii (strain ATCC 36239 / CBS 767 / BCRC 21394 / JCM 1990 / NBRC 0083 / IGC 2968) TaxID=284592 RepID=Q6BHE5_DEBHA|nr:DEHA2G19250p [Debaryomyces hansenii CBS767]CAG90883.1 DEHA2G19250p [Debaryomyces hansenii CBS767]|eukprot:XP_462376.1 DEHA2G19250p [Debaryomyces hansenii CBS767]